MRRLVLACLAMVCMAAGQANAGFTTVETRPYEQSLSSIMSTLYDGDGIVYTRVHDFDNALTDNVWRNLSGGQATATAKYANNNQTLDYVGENNGPSNLFQITGSTGFLNNPSANFPGPSSNLPEWFRFRLESPSGSTNYFSSDVSLNADGKDHMVTFLLDNGKYVIAFEDSTDNDFNDFVVEVDFFSPQAGPVVPEPATMALWGFGVLGMGFVVSRKRKLTATV